MLTVRDIC